MAERKRRQYRTGSIYQRSSDGRWMGTLQAGWNAAGGRRTINVSSSLPGPAGKAEVKRKLDKKRQEIERDGLPSQDTAGRATVKAWAETWLAQRVTRLRPKAYATTRSGVTRWIVPTIGHKRLAALTPGDVRAVTKAMRDAGLKTSTALRVHVTLTQMLKAAMVEGHAVPARCLLVDPPGVNVNDRQAMQVTEAVAVLGVATGLPHVSRWVAALLEGLRQGEALGLTWDAVDRVPGVMDISWQLQALPYLDKHDRSKGFRVPDRFEARHLVNAYHLIRPKTARGRRIIPIIPWMQTALDQWREIAPASPYGLVWPAADGSPASAKDDLAEWKFLQACAGVTHPSGRFYLGHETRHTTVMLLIEARVDRAVIEQIVGHARLVEAYVHAPEHMVAAALAQVAARLQLDGPAT